MGSTSTPNIFDADFDKSQLPPIDQKRLVAFVNHFLIDTAKFLNTFLVNCENRFVTLESRLQKINAELVVIESKIFQGELKNPASIDELQEDDKTQLDEDTVDRHTTNDAQTSNENTAEDNKQNQEDQTYTSEEMGVKVCEDVRYDKYFKMKQFGVPAEAVKLKMSAEGLDSSLLDQPNRILEDGIRKSTVVESD